MVQNNAQMKRGNHQLTWDVTDEKGSKIVPGLYILKMTTGTYTGTRKIAVIQ